MKIKAKDLIEAHQAMREFSHAMMPYAIESMGTSSSFYKVYRQHADRLAEVGAPLIVYARMAIENIELEIDHE
jgi:hypothetical protein